MAISSFAASTLSREARGLLTRLARVKPFALIMPAVAAAEVSSSAATAIEHYLVEGRRDLYTLVTRYLRWLDSAHGRRTEAAEAQRRLSILRLKFNAVLTQFDIFADALIQRSEYENGVWLAGLDLLAADALSLPGKFYRSPPVITYLDRGHGAAIRRARTRLPGGGKNPVAIIRIPRERMVGSGIASSLIHEVGHQGAALLNLIDSMRIVLRKEQKKHSPHRQTAWILWERWISEILADFWSVATVGVAATQGLIGVVSLPRAFVFRINIDDPHPIPWIRVKLSTAMGQALYPHPQWKKLSRLWDGYYPKADLDARKLDIIEVLEETMPQFVRLLINHRPKLLKGKSLRQAFPLAQRSPDNLALLFERWRRLPREMERASPSLVFAVLGQAGQNRKLAPAQESRIVANLLNKWAIKRATGFQSLPKSLRLQRSLSHKILAAAL